jgi:hypothetical protein
LKPRHIAQNQGHDREGKLRLLSTRAWIRASLRLPEKVADVKERGNEKIELPLGREANVKATVTISGQATLDLDADVLAAAAWVRMDAEQVVTFVVGRGLVGEDVPAHEVAHKKLFRSQ